jgi:F0F1-type ATP synthase membrane subunit a
MQLSPTPYLQNISNISYSPTYFFSILTINTAIPSKYIYKILKVFAAILHTYVFTILTVNAAIPPPIFSEY